MPLVQSRITTLKRHQSWAGHKFAGALAAMVVLAIAAFDMGCYSYRPHI